MSPLPDHAMTLREFAGIAAILIGGFILLYAALALVTA